MTIVIPITPQLILEITQELHGTDPNDWMRDVSMTIEAKDLLGDSAQLAQEMGQSFFYMRLSSFQLGFEVARRIYANRQA